MQGYENRTRVLATSLAPPLHLAWIGHTDGLCYYFSSPAVAAKKSEPSAPVLKVAP